MSNPTEDIYPILDRLIAYLGATVARHEIAIFEKELAALIQAAEKRGAEKALEKLEPLHSFLTGNQPYKGRWLGDEMKPSFWWRKDLQELLSELQDSPTPCPTCGGSGAVQGIGKTGNSFSKPVDCPTCKGTGIQEDSNQ